MKRVIRSGSFLVLLVCLLGACGEKQEEKKEVPVLEKPQPEIVKEKDETQEAIDEVYQEVMEIHDRSMAQMSEVRRLSQQLKDSIEHTNVNPMEQEEVINKYRNHLKELNNANQEMLQWMRQFDREGNGASTKEEKLEYFRKEKEKISSVDKQVNEALRSARGILQK